MLVIIAETRDSVLAPAIRPAPGVIVRQVIPRGATGTVVFAHGAPLPLGQIGSPPPPVFRAGFVVGQALSFRGWSFHTRSLRSLGARTESLVPDARWLEFAAPEFADNTTRSSRNTSPRDQAWKGQPRGVCGSSAPAISETWPRPASAR